jgi:hypothetical protein
MAGAHTVQSKDEMARHGLDAVYKTRVQKDAHNHACHCTPMRTKDLKSLADRQLLIGFHAVNSGSNPLGDAK